MDWGSVLEAIRDTYGIADVAKQNDRLGRALCETLRRLRAVPTSFNRGDLALTTVADQEEYERATAEGGATLLPFDFWGIQGRELYNETLQAQRTIYMQGAATYRRQKQRWASAASGYPAIFTAEQRKLKFHPAPAAAYSITGPYLKDLGVPVPVRRSSSVAYAPVAAMLYDDSETTYKDFTSELLDPTDSASPFPAGAGENDIAYFGFERVPSTPLTFTLGTNGAGTYTVTWQTWDGYSWVALAGVTDNTSNLQSDGTLVFTNPAVIEPKVVNSSDRLYWIRAIRDAGTVTTDPTITAVTHVGDDAWEYYLLENNGAERISTSTYTNLWFREAFQVLLHGAAYQHQFAYEQDSTQAQAALSRYQDALQAVRLNEAELLAVGEIRLSLGW